MWEPTLHQRCLGRVPRQLKIHAQRRRENSLLQEMQESSQIRSFAQKKCGWDRNIEIIRTDAEEKAK